MMSFLPEPIDVITPLGPAVVYGFWIYSEVTEWLTFIDSTGEPWWWRNEDLRLAPFVTGRRGDVSLFGSPSPKLQKHIDRYKNNGWL